MPERTLSSALTSAATLAGELATLFDQNDPPTPYLVGLGLEELQALLEALPLDTAGMCYCRNRVSSCRELWERGEWHAARYQMTELSRKLDRLRHEWS
jgi:hypothetical protein